MAKNCTFILTFLKKMKPFYFQSGWRLIQFIFRIFWTLFSPADCNLSAEFYLSEAGAGFPYLGGRRSCQVEPPADCQGIRGGCWDHQEARSSNSRRGPPPGRAACLAIQVKGEDGRQPTSHEESKPTSHGEGGSQPTGERRS